VGLYRRCGSRFWWMSYTMNDERYFESTKTTSKELANTDLEAKGRRNCLGVV
jgi:hypothetical protein